MALPCYPPIIHFGILSIRDVFQQAFLLQQSKQDATSVPESIADQ
jgi:hypothetical protein